MSDVYEFTHDKETRRMVAREVEELFGNASYRSEAVETAQTAVENPNSVAAVWLDMVTEIYLAYGGKVEMAYDGVMDRENPGRIAIRVWPDEENRWKHRRQFENEGFVKMSNWYSVEGFEDSPNRLRYL